MQQQAVYRSDNVQPQATAAGRQAAGAANMVVVTNVGYEPTTLRHHAAPSQSRPAPVVVDSPAEGFSTSARLNGDQDGYRSSARYSQTTTVQRVQAPSYATVQKATSPGSSAFQRAVVVDSSELVSRQQQEHERQQVRGVVVSGVRRLNKVNARQARLVPGWVTVFGRIYHIGM